MELVLSRLLYYLLTILKITTLHIVFCLYHMGEQNIFLHLFLGFFKVLAKWVECKKRLDDVYRTNI